MATPKPEPETPPRAWGRPGVKGVRGGVHGNTPTGVGKTCFEARKISRKEKHPHGRGEDPFPGGKILSLLETPPRAWGRLFIAVFIDADSGNTPTGVGKTKTIEVNLR